MNTLPAFTLAIEQGADGVELDVWRTRDGQLVVIHDDTVDGTTDGHGSVHAFTLAELKALDAGAWFGPQYAGTRIPTLDEVFAALPDTAIINVEIKKIDNETAATDGIEQLVADCILRHNAQHRVIVSSFSTHALRHFRAATPSVFIMIAYLYIDGSAEAQTGDLYDNLPFTHPYHELLTADTVTAVRAEGRYVNTWTVNDSVRMHDLLAFGVTGLITDRPDVGVAARQTWQAAQQS